MGTFTYIHTNAYTLHIIINYNIITVVAIKWIILIVNIRRPTKFVRFAHRRRKVWQWCEQFCWRRLSGCFYLLLSISSEYVIFNVTLAHVHCTLIFFVVMSCRFDQHRHHFDVYFYSLRNITHTHKIGNRNLVKLSSLTIGTRKKKQTENKDKSQITLQLFIAFCINITNHQRTLKHTNTYTHAAAYFCRRHIIIFFFLTR